MKAVRFHEYGGPEVLRLDDVPEPVPGPGQVLVQVAGTSFNGVDANIRAGAMQGPMPVALPHVPGVDVAGTVAALGAGVEGLAVGDAVVGFLPFTADGASAEQVVAPAGVLAPAPTSVPLADAAAMPLVALTAWQSLTEHGRLRAGQRVLVSGAGGAVGGYAVQLAHALGARVVAVAGPGSRDRLLARGAEQVVDRASTTPADALADQVDVVLNLAPLTPEGLAALVPLARDGGVVVSTTVWLPTPGDEARGVRGVDVYVRSDAAQLADLTARVDRGELVVDVAERVPLSGLADLHARAAGGRVAGKVVVLPAGDVA